MRKRKKQAAFTDPADLLQRQITITDDESGHEITVSIALDSPKIFSDAMSVAIAEGFNPSGGLVHYYETSTGEELFASAAKL